MRTLLLIFQHEFRGQLGVVGSKTGLMSFSINWSSLSLSLLASQLTCTNQQCEHLPDRGQGLGVVRQGGWAGRVDVQKGGMMKPICRPETPMDELFSFLFENNLCMLYV